MSSPVPSGEEEVGKPGRGKKGGVRERCTFSYCPALISVGDLVAVLLFKLNRFHFPKPSQSFARDCKW